MEDYGVVDDDITTQLFFRSELLAGASLVDIVDALAGSAVLPAFGDAMKDVYYASPTSFVFSGLLGFFTDTLELNITTILRKRGLRC